MEFRESGLLFQFDDSKWRVFQFDKHLDYKKVCDVVSETKAIDFLAISADDRKVVFMEIKSFRKHRLDPATQLRLANDAEELIIEIAQKVRDSLAVIVGASRNSTHDLNIWLTIAKALLNPRREVFVIPWVEEDNSHGFRAKRGKQKTSVRINKLKNKLKWLTPRVDVSNVKEPSSHIDGLRVSFLPENSP